MKPDKPGEWHSRSGQIILVFDFCGKLLYRDMAFGYGNATLDCLTGDDWLPAVAPEFPPLSPKPCLVCARERDYDPEWFNVDEGGDAHRIGAYSNGWISGRHLTVVPHPDNDPEAIRRLENAIPF